MNSTEPEWAPPEEVRNLCAGLAHDIQNARDSYRGPKAHSEILAYVAKFMARLAGCTEDMSLRYAQVAIRSIALFDFKQGRYGCGNVSQMGELGLVKRIGEKVERVSTMLSLKPLQPVPGDEGRWIVEEVGEPKDETRKDTWIDIGVLGLMGILVYEGKWPECRNLRLVELPGGDRGEEQVGAGQEGDDG